MTIGDSKICVWQNDVELSSDEEGDHEGLFWNVFVKKCALLSYFYAYFDRVAAKK